MAMKLAADHPHRVRTLTTIGGAVKGGDTRQWRADLERLGVAAWAEASMPARFGTMLARGDPMVDRPHRTHAAEHDAKLFALGARRRYCERREAHRLSDARHCCGCPVSCDLSPKRSHGSNRFPTRISRHCRATAGTWAVPGRRIAHA